MTIPHGTQSRYAKGCRCPHCQEAHAHLAWGYRQFREPADVKARRLARDAERKAAATEPG